MAAGLSAILTNYRTVLAAAAGSGTGAGLTNLPPNVEIEDMPTSILHRSFSLTKGWGPRTRIVHGTNTNEYEAELVLALHHDPGIDVEAASNTIADDAEAAMWVMEKAANRATATTGTMIVEIGGGFSEPTLAGPNDLRSEARFVVRYRVTQDKS